MFWWKYRKIKPQIETDDMIVDLLPGCDFCQQHYPANHVLYQAARWYGKTDFGYRDMCLPHYRAYGNGKGQRIVLREKEK